MDEIQKRFKNIETRLENIEKGLIIKKITIPPDGRFIVKVLSADPVTPVANEMWINSSSWHLKIYLNGVVVTIV